MSDLFLPSHEQGYAHSPGESANPGRWDSLAGEWLPSLGPTGSTLYDNSGTNNGTVIGSPYAADHLAFNGTSDRVEIPLDPRWDGIPNMTIWTRHRVNKIANFDDLWSFGPGAAQEAYLFINSGKWAYKLPTDGTQQFIGNTPVLDYLTAVDNRWHDIALVATNKIGSDGGEIYLDGKLLSLDYGNGLIQLTEYMTLGSAQAGNYCECDISHHAIWTRALNADEIWELHRDPDGSARLQEEGYTVRAAAIRNRGIRTGGRMGSDRGIKTGGML